MGVVRSVGGVAKKKGEELHLVTPCLSGKHALEKLH